MSLIEVLPHPAGTLVALSGGGYTPHAAVADLIDNAISAGAKVISLHLDISGEGVLSIEDDGRGMDQETLTEAMRVSTGWGTVRADDDLGRFGTGMKAAALHLSEVGRFTVSSAAADGTGTAITMDLRQIEKEDRWVVHREDRVGLKRGTRVEIIGPLFPRRQEEASAGLMALSGHLRVTFAAQLQGGLKIMLQGKSLEPWALCTSDLPGMTSMSSRPLKGRVRVTPFILPTDTEDPMVEGPLGRQAHAGFHVHRSGRAIVSGGWLGLNAGKRGSGERDRIRLLVEIGPEHDVLWKVTLPKSGCTLPQMYRKPLKLLLDEVLIRAGRQRAVRTDVGTRRRNREAWTNDGLIRREHPLVAKVFELSSDVAAVEQLLAVLEGGHQDG